MKNPNQKRGPTTGNAGNAAKREEFMSAKATSGSRRSELANMVTSALESRGRNMRTSRSPATEPVKAELNVGKKKK